MPGIIKHELKLSETTSRDIGTPSNLNNRVLRDLDALAYHQGPGKTQIRSYLAPVTHGGVPRDLSASMDEIRGTIGLQIHAKTP